MLTTTPQPVTYGNVSSLAKFSLERYHRMTASGILTPDDKVELLENYVVLKMARNPRHDSTVQRMLRPLFTPLPANWDLRIQGAVTLTDSEPEPHYAVVRGRAANYERRHPTPGDIGALMEVADSSLLRDQRDKTRIYARANIPVYWIVNLVDRRIEVYTQPSGPTESPSYAACQVYVPGQEVPLVLDGAVACSVPVDALLPE